MFLTKEDYFKARGIRLELEFQNAPTDNESNVVDTILQEIEDELIETMQFYFEYPVGFTKEDLDKEVMKKAMIYQIDYLRTNGQLSNDLGFEGYNICKKAEHILRMNGYANIKKAGSRGYRYGKRY